MTTRKHVNAAAAFLIEHCNEPIETAAQKARQLLDACGYGPTETTCSECSTDLVGPICPACNPEIFGAKDTRGSV